MTWQDYGHLYTNVSRMMIYWCGRIMFDMASVDALSLARGKHPATIRSERYHSRYRRYWRLRAQGLSYYEARAKLDGNTPEKTRQLNIEACRRYRDQWGGWVKPGTATYTRWLLAR